jgi:hypothetical protein
VAGVTDTQSLRFGQVTDVITHTMQANLADDIATQLDAANTAAVPVLKPPVVYIRRNANQLFSVGVRAGIAFDAVIYDTNTMTNTGTQPLRAAIVGASSGIGTYMFDGMINLSTTGSCSAGHISFWKNGVTLLGQRTIWAQRGPVTLGLQVYLGTLGDYVEMHYQYDGTGTPTVIFAECWVHKLSL